MAWFKIYTEVMGSRFSSGVTYQGTFKFDDDDEARQAAHDKAMDQYQAYEGTSDIYSYDDCWQEIFDEDPIYFEDHDEECHDLAWQLYYETVESSIDYFVEEVPSPN